MSIVMLNFLIFLLRTKLRLVIILLTIYLVILLRIHINVFLFTCRLVYHGLQSSTIPSPNFFSVYLVAVTGILPSVSPLLKKPIKILNLTYSFVKSVCKMIFLHENINIMYL